MRQVLDAIPPASGGIVPGCGIVSVDLYSDHQPVLSAVMLWFAARVWLLLAVILGTRLAYQRDRFGREARSPPRSRALIWKPAEDGGDMPSRDSSKCRVADRDGPVCCWRRRGASSALLGFAW
jgi:hypothetical protein